jgi:serine/threonine protein kinase/tetratricopeptide (TPR) repeat protein
LGPYVITDVIGEGGMGVVYRAHGTPESDRVAIKTVRVASESQLSSIRREIRALTKLRHPGVVRVLRDGIDGGRPWYAMELLEGQTLADYNRNKWGALWGTEHTADGSTDDERTIREVPEEKSINTAWGDSDRLLPPVHPAAGGELIRGLTIIRRILGPLAFLHGEGIVHRDLKPQNVFLRKGDRPVLVDFGLAWGSPGARGREVLDTPADIVGTPSYMAPEQIRGELVDARADLYAVGCLLFEVITGRPPFIGDGAAQIMGKHLHRAPVAPSRIVDGVPAELDELVGSLLAKDIRDRIGHADDAVHILDKLGAEPSEEPASKARVYVYRPALAGRDMALAELAASIDDARRARGSVALIAGESGIGKTYLAIEVARRAGPAAFNTITSTCAPVGMFHQGPRGTPLHAFRPLLQAIADRCTAFGVDTTDKLLGRRGPVLASIEPQLASLPGQNKYPAPPELEGPAARDRLLHCLRETLGSYAEHSPLLLLIDDLQWADELSLLFLNSLPSWFLSDQRILILCTYRTEETTTGIRDLVEQPYTTEVCLDRLDDGAVGSLINDMLAVDSAPREFVDTLARHAEGNPFFVAEYLRTAAAEGLLHRLPTRSLELRGDADHNGVYDALELPHTLRELVGRRLEGLSSAARTLVAVASVVGREMHPSVLQRAAAIDDDLAWEAINELLARQVLETADDGRVRFVHDKLCEIAYDGIEPGARPAMHGAAAGAIEDHFAGSDELAFHYGVLAHHYAEAGDVGKAVEYLERAGERAMATSSYADAVALWQKLIDTDAQRGDEAATPRHRARWQRQLGEASFNLGDLDGAEEHTAAALHDLGRPLPRTRGGWMRELGSQLVRQTAHRLGVRRGTASNTDERNDLLESATGAGTMAWRYFFVDDIVGVVAMSLWSVNEIERADPPIEAASPYAWLGYTAGTMRLHRLARFYFDRAREHATTTADVPGGAFTDLMEGVYQSGFARWTRVEDVGTRALMRLDGTGDPQNIERHLCLLANAFYYAARFDESVEMFDKLLESARTRQNVQHTAWGLYARCLGLIAKGELEAAVPLLHEASELLATITDVASQIITHGMLGVVYLRLGDTQNARKWADDALHKISQVRTAVYSTISGYGAVAEVMLELLDAAGGRDRALTTRVKQALAATRKFALMFPFGAPMHHRYRGQFLALRGRMLLARRAFARSIELAETFEMPYEQAQTHLIAARHSRGRARAHHIERAAELFERLGCAYHSARIAELT